jgi:hypothetical protein
MKELPTITAPSGIVWTVGQKVIVYGTQTRHVGEISRITDGRGGTIYVGEASYDINGHQRGSTLWGGSHLELSTPEALQAIRAERAKNLLSKFNWHSLPDDAEAITRLQCTFNL